MILSLSEHTIAITGALKRMTRAKAYSFILAEDGVPKDKITKDTDFLVVADSECYETTKIQKAKKWGIEILCEDDFYELIGA